MKTVEEYLAENGAYVATTAGFSMAPLLRDKTCAVKIVPADGRLKKYDVALFRRGKKLVLHRVVRVRPDRYFIRGDNEESGEWVLDEQIVGVLSEITGKDKHIKVTDSAYLAYSRLIVLFYPCRYVAKKAYRLARRAAHRVLRGKSGGAKG